MATVNKRALCHWYKIQKLDAVANKIVALYIAS